MAALDNMEHLTRTSALSLPPLAFRGRTVRNPHLEARRTTAA